MQFCIGSYSSRHIQLITAWRIVRADYAATAMDGEGASRYGGRWNSAGTNVVYLAETRALAALEIIVHVDRILLSVPYVVIPVQFDDSQLQKNTELPDAWDSPIIPELTRLIGDDWVNISIFGTTACTIYYCCRRMELSVQPRASGCR